MNKKILLSLSCFMVVVFASFAQTAKPPLWMSDLKKAYPSKDFLAFEGQGKDIKFAREDGLSQLAGFYGVSVQSLVEGKTKITENNTSSSFERKMDESVQVRVSQDLFAVRYSEAFVAKDGTHIVVYQNIAEASKVMGDSIAKISKKLKALIAGVASAPNLLVSLAKALAAKKLAEKAEDLIAKFRLLNAETARIAAADVPIDDAYDAYDEYKGKARIQVVATNDLAKAMKARVDSAINKEGYPIDPKGLIKLEFSASQTEVSITDKAKTIEWTYTLVLSDDSKAEMVSKSKTNRSSGTSLVVAKTLSDKELENFLKNDFLPALSEYLISYLN